MCVGGSLCYTFDQQDCNRVSEQIGVTCANGTVINYAFMDV